MRFKDIKIGQIAELIHQITKDDVLRFTNLTGDVNSVHADPDGIVHGMLIASFISTLIGTQLPGDGAVWMSCNITFVNSVYRDDVIMVSGVVKDIDVTDKRIKLYVDVMNQRGEECLLSTCWIKVPK
jgi:3-oxoacyl-[acyl-carrier protein] reductase